MENVTVDAYGYQIGFQYSEPELWPVVKAAILPDWSVLPGQSIHTKFELSLRDGSVDIVQDGVLRVSGLTLDSAEDVLRGFSQLELAAGCQRYVFLQAGVVKIGQGVIVLPGSSYFGKSRLVRSLLDRGGVYYSDEFALIDSDGRIRPYPRPMRERLDRFRCTFTPAGKLGWTEKLGAEVPIFIAILQYREGEVSDFPELTKGEGVLRLLEHTACARTVPELALTHLAACVKRCPVYHGVRGESDEAADLILSMIDGSFDVGSSLQS